MDDYLCFLPRRDQQHLVNCVDPKCEKKKTEQTGYEVLTLCYSIKGERF